jgi:ELWxxDGT repeat protein
VTDGTAGGTKELTGIRGAAASGLSPRSLTVFKNEALFSGVDTAGDRGLWVTDGTAKGTHELTVKGANPSGLNPSNFTVLGNEVLFNGIDANGQIGLWETNGTSSGTHELTGINGAYTGSGGLNPQDLTAVTLQLVQSMASLSPTGSASTVSPLNQTTNDLMQLSNHLTQPH